VDQITEKINKAIEAKKKSKLMPIDMRKEVVHKLIEYF